MRKKNYVTLTLVTMLCSNFVFGQYVNDFMAVYPFNKGSNTTKNYTFTKDIAEISKPGYMLMANSYVSPTNLALAALKLDIDFNVVLTRSYLPSSSVNTTSIIALDVIATSTGGYVACGTVQYDKLIYAFMAGFDSKASPLWYKEYPQIKSLNAVIEVYTSSTKLKYVACGTYNSSTYATGMILGTDNMGIPVWRNCTQLSTRSDQFVYNDIIPVMNATSKDYLLAVVGNAVTQPYSNKDVILTMLDLGGNMKFSYLYGLPTDSTNTFEEEGYGLVLSPKEQIVITGRSKRISPLTKWDDALMFAVDLYGNLKWSYRYDIPKSAGNGEYAQKILTLNDNLYVSGYYVGYAFLSKGSYDAFMFETYLNGKPTQVRVYGDSNADLFYANEVNHKKDGIISAGFSDSFTLSPTGAPAYAPYIVEAYKEIKEPCHSVIFELPYKETKLDIRKIESYLVKTSYTPKELKEIKNPVNERVICKKSSLLLESGVAKSAPAEELIPTSVKQLKNSNDPVIYPNPTGKTLFIEGVEINSNYKIYNNTGKLVRQGRIADSSIDLTELQKGLYFISIVNAQGQTKVKFVKE